MQEIDLNPTPGVRLPDVFFPGIQGANLAGCAFLVFENGVVPLRDVAWIERVLDESGETIVGFNVAVHGTNDVTVVHMKPISSPKSDEPSAVGSGGSVGLSVEVLDDGQAGGGLDAAVPDETCRADARPPEELNQNAYQGPIGEIARRIQPTVDESPAAVLVQLLTSFGNLVGDAPCIQIGAARHSLNLFTCLIVPRSEPDRTYSRRVIRVLSPVDLSWPSPIAVGSIASLVDRIDDGEDRRKLFLIPELDVLPDDGSTGVLLEHWEQLFPHVAGSHVSMIARASVEQAASPGFVPVGLVHRFLWVWSSSTESGPVAAFDPDSVREPIDDLKTALSVARAAHVEFSPIIRSRSTEDLWFSIFPRISPFKDGTLDWRLNGPAHVLRIAAIYAVAEQCCVIHPCHLEAAAAVWDYAARSVEFVFGDRPVGA